MSAIDIFNEKFIQCKEIDTKIADITTNKQGLNEIISEIDAQITTKTSEKTIIDAELLVLQSNLPSNIETYKIKYLECNVINNALVQLNRRKIFITEKLTEVSAKLEAAIETKAILDAEYTVAMSSL